MQPWMIGAAANVAVAVAYLAISAAILASLVRSHQLGANRLGAATAAIFFTCAVHHGSHSVRMLLPLVGLETHAGLALRQAFEWHSVVWDVVSAGFGVYYWTLRRTYGPLMQGAKLFEDLKERQRQALEINDNVVQGLAVAHMALSLDDREQSLETLEGTLAAARKIISDLLGDAKSGGQLNAGDLIRTHPALVGPST